ncbi:hypothetical protein RFI_32475, partial [Reticulomyxa filosa]
MAPEVIEMSGQLTTACDIWGIGATAIELFTGHPPYFNMQPLTALFRIVQDRHPPYPPQISQVMFMCFFFFVMYYLIQTNEWKQLYLYSHICSICTFLFEGFLNRCFVKEAQHRANAEELIKMAWFSKTLTIEEHEAFLQWAGMDKKNKSKKPTKKSRAHKTAKNPPVQSDGETSDVGSGKETLSSSDEASEAQPKKQPNKNKEEIVGGIGEQTAGQSNTGANVHVIEAGPGDVTTETQSEQKIAENTSQVPSDQNTAKVDSHEDEEEESEASDDDKEDLNTLKSTFKYTMEQLEEIQKLKIKKKEKGKEKTGKTGSEKPVKKSEASDDANTNDVVNPGVPTLHIDKKDGSANDVVKHKHQAK